MSKIEAKSNLEFEKEVTRNIGAITQAVTDSVIKNSQEKLESLISSTESRLSEIEKNQPVLSVKIGKGEEVKLSSKAVPYLERLIVNSQLGLKTLLVGPAGCGKTTAAKQLSEALKLKFGSVCLTAGASETWLFGRQTPTGFVEGIFSELYRNGGVFLADEMDAADANLLLSINTALANGQMYNPMNGEKIEQHKDFIFIGAANTFGKGGNHVYTGRSRLDGATLDRFVNIEVDYDKEYEKTVCKSKTIYNFLTGVREDLRYSDLEEFVSTRMFEAFQKQYEAGISTEEISKSMTLAWGDEAQRISQSRFKKHSMAKLGKPAKKDK